MILIIIKAFIAVGKRAFGKFQKSSSTCSKVATPHGGLLLCNVLIIKHLPPPPTT
ncbi:MAG: hypothetical protein LBR36_01160 [Bacteroidales bacterium]|nr:hypothetical protein [Bacteroidales bacterium]